MEKSPLLTAKTSVQPAQPANVTPPPATVDQAAIVSVLEAWAAAWSAQAPEQYLAFYDPQFHPAGQSRRKWQALRIKRIKRPQWIRVALSDIIVKPLTGKRVRVELQQHYQSNTYSDNERKEFILMQTETGWHIVSERNI